MATPGLAPEDLLRIRLIGAPVFSPDGSRVLLVEQWLDGKENRQSTRLLICDPDSGETRPFTEGPSDRHARWSPDGLQVAFQRKVDGVSQLHLMSTQGGEPRQATSLRHGVDAFCWTADARSLVLSAPLKGAAVEEGPAPEPESDEERHTKDVRRLGRLYHKLDGEGFFEETRLGLVRLDLPSGDLTVLDAGDYDCLDPVAAAGGTLVAYTSRRVPDPDLHADVMDVYALDAAGGAPRRLTQGNLGAHSPAFSRDGRSVYFLASDPRDLGYGHTRVYRASLEGDVECLSSGLDRSLEDVSGSDLVPPSRTPVIADENAVYVPISSEGRVGIQRLEAHGEWSPQVFGDRCVYAYDYHPARGFAIAYSDFLTPSAVAVVRGGKERILVRGEVPEDVQAAFSSPVHLTASAQGGPRVDAWLLAPEAPKEKVPLVLEVHGGPMSMYGLRAHFEFQLLRSRGYAVLFSNPRGSQGYAEDFCSAIVGRWGEKDYEDVLAVLDEALARFPELDPSRLGIAGGSYGGFMVNWAIGHSDRFKAAVTMRSVVNRMSAMGTSDLGFLRVPHYGPLWWEDPSPYLQQSPLTYASRIRTPLLIEHQEEDLRLPIEQGEQMFTALRYLGRTVEMLRYPGESHGMSRTGKPWHRVHRLRAILDWFSRYL